MLLSDRNRKRWRQGEREQRHINRVTETKIAVESESCSQTQRDKEKNRKGLKERGRRQTQR